MTVRIVDSTTRNRLIAVFALLIGGSACGCGSDGGTENDKLAAEWVIQRGGTVSIANRQTKITTEDQLPAETFAVEKIVLNQVTPPITDKDLIDLPTAAGVKHLGLHSAQITDKGLTTLNTLRNLQELELSYTQVSDAGLQELTGLKKLKKLYLYGTQVSAEGIEEFEKKRPGCTVYRD